MFTSMSMDMITDMFTGMRSMFGNIPASMLADILTTVSAEGLKTKDKRPRHKGQVQRAHVWGVKGGAS